MNQCLNGSDVSRLTDCASMNTSILGKGSSDNWFQVMPNDYAVKNSYCYP